jgi:citrate synthase
MASSTADRITVRGFDLAGQLMGNVNLGDMAFLELLGRLPSEGESRVFNAMLVALVEHGITPNTIAARLTYLGAPESVQGAVAAGLLGLGSVFVGTIEGSARVLQEATPQLRRGERAQEGGAGSSSVALEDLAAGIVAEYRQRRQAIPGLGHPIHKPVDPRTVRLFAIASEEGISGEYVALMNAIGVEANQRAGRELPVNVTGAIGALASELGIPWQICRGLGLMARSIGLVGHVLEEMKTPMAMEIWRQVEEEAAPQDERR